jgi:outer membrane protein assembly factor BamA
MLRLRGVVVPLAFAACVHLVARPLHAQGAAAADDPVVERVAIRGVSGVELGELRAGLATQPSRCRSIVFQPFCWVTDAGFFVERHRLDRAELPQDELRIRVHLWRRGWRHATVATRVEPRGSGVQVTFDVAQGPPTLVRSVSVSQDAPVLTARQIRRAELPDSGRPLNVIDLDSARVRLLDALWDRGYGDAVVRDTTRLLDTLSAALEVRVEPGRRTTVGRIEVEGNQRVSDRTVADAMPLRAGGLYRPPAAAESERALFLTGMFEQVLVEVPPQPDTAKTVRVSVAEAPFRLIRTRVGFTTIDYLQTQAHFTHYDWLGGGRRLDLSAVLGRLLAPQLEGTFPFEASAPPLLSGADEDDFLRPTWQASAQVTQPAFPLAGTSVGVGVFTHRRVEPSIVVDRGFGASVTLTREVADRAPLSLLYRFERNSILAGDVYFCVNFGVCD